MEIFIYLIAVLIKYDELDYFLNEKYLINGNYHQNSAFYLEFKKPIRILDKYRNPCYFALIESEKDVLPCWSRIRTSSAKLTFLLLNLSVNLPPLPTLSLLSPP